MMRNGIVVCLLCKGAPSSDSEADSTTLFSTWHSVCSGPFFIGFRLVGELC